MFTNMNNCTIYEKSMQNRAYTFIRHEIGAVYWENSCSQKDGKDRVPSNSALVIIPEKSADYLPKTDDKIVCGIIHDERAPSNAMTIVKVRDFRYGSAKIRHIEVTAE